MRKDEMIIKSKICNFCKNKNDNNCMEFKRWYKKHLKIYKCENFSKE